MNVKSIKSKAKELHDQAQALFKQANEIEQAELLPKFQYLKNKCFKLKEEYNGEKWNIYYLVKEVTNVYKNKREVSATLKCVSFNDCKSSIAFDFEDTQLYDTLRHLKAREISRQEFDDALEKNYARIQLATEIDDLIYFM